MSRKQINLSGNYRTGYLSETNTADGPPACPQREVVLLLGRMERATAPISTFGDKIRRLFSSVSPEVAARRSATKKWHDHFFLGGRDLDDIPPAEVTPELLCMANRDGTTVAHLLASWRQLHKLPPSLRTAELFSMADPSCHTVAHVAAIKGELHLAPREMMTPEFFALRAMNGQGRTIGHHLAKYSHLNDIEPGMITREFLSMPAAAGNSVAHAAAQNLSLDQIPLEMLTESVFDMQNNNRMTVRDFADDDQLDSIMSKQALQREQSALRMQVRPPVFESALPSKAVEQDQEY